MEFLLQTGAAASATLLLVSMFKHAWLTAPSWAVVLSALACGQLASFLVTLAEGKQPTSQVIALAIMAGISASASAIGIRASDNSADAKREQVQP